jgi:hypothetical protein
MALLPVALEEPERTFVTEASDIPGAASLPSDGGCACAVLG